MTPERMKEIEQLYTFDPKHPRGWTFKGHVGDAIAEIPELLAALKERCAQLNFIDREVLPNALNERHALESRIQSLEAQVDKDRASLLDEQRRANALGARVERLERVREAAEPIAERSFIYTRSGDYQEVCECCEGGYWKGNVQHKPDCEIEALRAALEASEADCRESMGRAGMHERNQRDLESEKAALKENIQPHQQNAMTPRDERLSQLKDAIEENRKHPSNPLLIEQSKDERIRGLITEHDRTLEVLSSCHAELEKAKSENASLTAENKRLKDRLKNSDGALELICAKYNADIKDRKKMELNETYLNQIRDGLKELPEFDELTKAVYEMPPHECGAGGIIGTAAVIIRKSAAENADLRARVEALEKSVCEAVSTYFVLQGSKGYLADYRAHEINLLSVIRAALSGAKGESKP